MSRARLYRPFSGALLIAIFGLLPVPALAITMTDETGGDQPHTNMQPSLGLNHIIALTGIFPSRNITTGDPDSDNLEILGIEPFIGEIGLFAGNFAPRGFAFTNGQLLPISSNQALYSLLGTTYGGDGRTTFALPDLRGRTPIHAGTGPGLTQRRLGERTGVEEVVLTESTMPAHSHAAPAPFALIGSTGGGQPHEDMQPSLGLNHIISLTGVFPSRNITNGDPDTDNLELAGTEPFIGEIELFAGNFAPRGWAFTDGQLLPIASHTALFSLLGTTYGGDGRTTFALPDLRGRTTIHEGTGPGLTQRRLGERTGAEVVELTETTMPKHSHTLPLPDNTNDPTTFDTGGGELHTNMQPSLGLNYIIALTGIFPSRNITTGDADADALEIAGNEPIIGEIALFAGNFAPRGWAFTDGQLLSVSQNQSLFAILGTTYGGDGRTTFALPDLRGRTAIHAGAGPGLTPRQLGKTTGVESVALTIGQMPAHSHTAATLLSELLIDSPHETLAIDGNVKIVAGAEVDVTPGFTQASATLETILAATYTGALTGLLTNEGEHLRDGIFVDAIHYNAGDITVDILKAAPGDINGDRLVDATDIQLILAANSFNNGAGFDWTDGDNNGDGLVNADDIQNILATNLFGKPAYVALPGSAAAVPEPSSFVLAVLAVVGLVAFGRRNRR